MSAYEDRFKSSSSEAAAASAAEDKIDESQSLSVSKGKDKVTESYDTDTFEDQSVSQSKSLSMEGSGKKASTSGDKGGGINYWPGSKAFESDASLSQSKEKDASGDAKMHSVNAMEEYLKKMEAKKAPESPCGTSSVKNSTVVPVTTPVTDSKGSAASTS